MFEPSGRASATPQELLKLCSGKKKGRKKPPKTDYVPAVDGVNGVAPIEVRNELSGYSADLDKLEVEVEDDQPDSDELLLDQQELESLPW